jgi:hypothetical protein
MLRIKRSVQHTYNTQVSYSFSKSNFALKICKSFLRSKFCLLLSRGKMTNFYGIIQYTF